MIAQTSTELLNHEYSKRKAKNPTYSLRAFARDLGVSRTVISDVVRGVRRLSNQNIEVVAKSLNLDESTVESLKADLVSVQEESRQLLEGDLSFIEDWHYLAIMNLAKLTHSEFSANWVAERLGISEKIADEALTYLSKKGFIDSHEGKIRRLSKLFTTPLDIPSSSIVESHRQSINKALEALEDVVVDKRDFTSVTYAFDPEHIKEVKDMILKFHRRLGKHLETTNASEVYRLNIQFFPLTKTGEIEDHY